ncbi:hypothetical protein BJ980_002337 [Nocardioides daedukensis]|uniref:Nucleotidyltransferase family protein n=1 Tax=Nocardioides daedukensis TaxID=634462 RepID=A0A7Y9UTX3_9ACTN|nr:hypothetical protein [Nocardioides daedukensis]NYG59414.1 hypothetical protein [Nocardioides daedukensis]
MNDPIVLPAMDKAQAASWHAIMALYAKLPENWALVGGQLVHLHCAERGAYPTRPTTDADAVVNIRADPLMLTRFTAALVDLGFTADTSGEGHQHRWRRGLAQVDVLIPEGIGERAASRHGIGGAPTVSSPGTASRHCVDFVVLASLVAARDFRTSPLSLKDKLRLKRMIGHCQADSAAMGVDEADAHLDRLSLALDR